MDGVAGFTATTRAIDDVHAADAEALGAAGPVSVVWARGDDRMIGYGLADRRVFRGPGRFLEAAVHWRDVTAASAVDDGVGLAGTGLIAFGTFAFADGSSAESVLVVPRRIVGRRAGRRFVTEVTGGAGLPVRAAAASARPAFPPGAYADAVEQAVARIRAGALEKVVLARDLLVERRPDFDLARALRTLRRRYRDAYTFGVDGFFGASPETLVASDGVAVTARVLAGTAARNDEPTADAAARDALLGSAKNRFEHALAVDSLLLTLGPLVHELDIGRPFALGLANVWHLATDAAGRLREAAGALDLVAALHPTAAVAGAPRAEALALIRELEPFDRGRYAGPVGWIDGRGAGEWAIGLRSAELLDDGAVRAYAGAGIVADSVPGAELAETQWKFAPVLEALGR